MKKAFCTEITRIVTASGLDVELINSTDAQLIELKSNDDYDKLKYDFKDFNMPNG